MKINSFSPCRQEDVEANFGDLEKAKKERNYKIRWTIATIMFFLVFVVFYLCHIVIGFPIIHVLAFTCFGNIIGSAMFIASYKDFAYANN